MPERRLTSLKNNKKKLLENVGATSIKEFRRENPEFTSDTTAYNYLLGEYNSEVDRLNEQERVAKEAAKRAAKKAKEEEKKKENEYVKKNVAIIKQDINTLKNELKKRKGKSVIVEYAVGKKVIISRQYTISEDFNVWWNAHNVYLDFQEDSPNLVWDDYPKGKLYMYTENDRINSTKIRQAFREGITNCLLTPIRDWIDDKVEESKTTRTKQHYAKMRKDIDRFLIEYKNGVPENDIAIVCEKLQIDIEVTTPFSDITLIDVKSTKKALRKFRYLNTRINHTELNEVVSEDNIIDVLTQEEMRELRDQFDSDGIYYTYNKNMNGVNQISTLDAKYILNSDYMKAVNEFETDYNLHHCRIDDIQDKELSQFVRAGVHYNETIDFNPTIVKQGITPKIKHIDLSKAYTQFKQCKYYNGFLGKITDFRETDKVEGVGMYYIYDLCFSDNNFKAYNDKMVMYVDHNIYTDAELKMLDDNGVTYKITGGCWGVEPLDFSFTDDMINCKDENVVGNGRVIKIPFYSKWSGSCNSLRLKKSFWIKGDEELAQIIRENSDGIVRNYWNGEIQIEYKKFYAKHLSHITAFITAYMRMNMIQQLLTMDINNLVRICCDGIYFVGDKIAIPAIFEYKTKMTFKNEAAASYCSGLNSDLECVDWGGSRKHNKKELHLGEGGSGKTHYNLSDKGLVRPMFVTPSWKLGRAKEKETGIKCSVWARALSDDPEKTNFIKQNANTIVWDEVSMMSEEAKQYIFKTYGNIKHIFCGDLGYQLPCIDGEPMLTTGFDEIIYHKQDHRCKCPELKKIKVTLRKMIDNEKSLNEINLWCVRKFRSLNRTITKKKLTELYEINDMILVGTKYLRDLYTKMFTGKFQNEKYYVTSNNRLYSNGEIVIGEPEKTVCEVRHAFTTHSIQGETAENKLFIDCSKMFDSRMFYTAISRARNINQIYIIE
jgi:hypothetical protein